MSKIIEKKEKNKKYIIFKTSALVYIPIIITILGILWVIVGNYLKKLFF